MNDNDTSWEREVVTKLAESSLREQRRARRWSIFFKSLTFAYIGAIIYMYGNASDIASASLKEKHTAVVELNGVIADTEEASADSIITAARIATKKTVLNFFRIEEEFI